jgi:hypothetical protein
VAWEFQEFLGHRADLGRNVVVGGGDPEPTRPLYYVVVR